MDALHLSLHAALVARDSAIAPFAAVFTVANSAAHLSRRVSELETLLAEQKELTHRAEALGSPDTLRKLADTERENASLKDELRDMYKTQSINAQRLLDMVESTKAHETRSKALTEENAKLTTANQSLTIRIRDASELLKEKDGVIQILKDEMAALQLELVQREDQLKQATAKAVKLEAENNELVDRWMKLKQEEAAKMNEANEFLESAQKKQAEIAMRQNSVSSVQFEDG
ncbi:hypothetical protein HDU83_005720, partial [Entophlyctis luteolus]